MGIFSAITTRVRGFFGDTAKSAQGLLAGVLQGGLAPRRGTRELLDAYRTSPWLHVVVLKVAMEVASTQWRLYRTKRKANAETKHLKAAVAHAPVGGVELDSHPVLDLFANPSPVFTRSTFFSLAQAFLDLKGECFIVLERNALGPAEMWIVPPHWCIDLPTAAFPFYRFQSGAWVRSIPEGDVIFIRHPELLNPYTRGVGIGEALADEIDIDEYATQHLKTWFFNRALPDAFLSVDGLTNEKEALRYQEQLRAKHGGMNRGFQLHVAGGKIDLKQLGHSFREQQLPELRTAQRDTILQAYGVPPEIVGVVENSNRATIEGALVVFTRFCVAPRAAFLADALTHWARREYNDPSLCIGFESPVPEDREFALKVMTSQPDLFTKNEFRTLAGREPVPGWDLEFVEKSQPLALGAGATGGEEDGVEEEDEGKPAETDDVLEQDDDEQKTARRFLRLVGHPLGQRG